MARERLADWLGEPGRTQAKLARDLGLSGASVSAWLSGHARPEAHYRIALERITGGAVPATSWMTDKEREVAFGRWRAP